jgi:hypothetical protein
MKIRLVMVGARIDPGTHVRLMEMCDRLGVRSSDVVRAGVERILDEIEKKGFLKITRELPLKDGKPKEEAAA